MKLLIYLSLLFKLFLLEDIILEKPDGEKILVNNIDNYFSENSSQLTFYVFIFK